MDTWVLTKEDYIELLAIIALCEAGTVHTTPDQREKFGPELVGAALMAVEHDTKNNKKNMHRKKLLQSIPSVVMKLQGVSNTRRKCQKGRKPALKAVEVLVDVE